MGVGDFTAVSVCRDRISPYRFANIFFRVGSFSDIGLHPQPRILRWVPRRSTCRTRKVCQGGQPSHLHSASFFRVGMRMGRAAT
jgi:hypothetical protein